MVDISFVIPIYHEYPAIIHTVNSIQVEMSNTDYKYEINVVENGEIDPYTEAFKQFYRVPIQRKLINYYFEPHQGGPAARWKGIEMSRGKYIITMDGHTELGKNTVVRMVKAFEKIDNAASIHGTTVKTHLVPPKVRGAHYRLFGNRGHNLNQQFQGAYSQPQHVGIDKQVYPCVGVNLAYFLQEREEMLRIRGYHPKCTYQPHPEGYYPLKSLMFGKVPYVDPNVYHFHSVYRMQKEYRAYLEKLGWFQRKKWEIEIKGDPHNLVGQDFLICNAMITAYTLGGDKWIDIIYDSWEPKIRSKYVLNGIKEYAKEVSQEERKHVLDNAEHTLDQILIWARKNKVAGMENWFDPIGDDPLA